jgi:hypothetical protein
MFCYTMIVDDSVLLRHDINVCGVRTRLGIGFPNTTLPDSIKYQNFGSSNDRYW